MALCHQRQPAQCPVPSSTWSRRIDAVISGRCSKNSMMAFGPGAVTGSDAMSVPDDDVHQR
jgi:hypothetical protein